MEKIDKTAGLVKPVRGGRKRQPSTQSGSGVLQQVITTTAADADADPTPVSTTTNGLATLLCPTAAPGVKKRGRKPKQQPGAPEAQNTQDTQDTQDITDAMTDAMIDTSHATIVLQSQNQSATASLRAKKEQSQKQSQSQKQKQKQEHKQEHQKQEPEPVKNTLNLNSIDVAYDDVDVSELTNVIVSETSAINPTTTQTVTKKLKIYSAAFADESQPADAARADVAGGTPASAGVKLSSTICSDDEHVILQLRVHTSQSEDDDTQGCHPPNAYNAYNAYDANGAASILAMDCETDHEDVQAPSVVDCHPHSNEKSNTDSSITSIHSNNHNNDHTNHDLIGEDTGDAPFNDCSMVGAMLGVLGMDATELHTQESTLNGSVLSGNIRNNLNKNMNTNNSTTSTQQQSPTGAYHLTPASRIVRVLMDFEQKSRVKEWPNSTSVHCYWCCHKFDNMPFGLPIKYRGGRYQVCGCFCSLECAAAWNFSCKDSLDEIYERYALTNMLSAQLGHTRVVRPAPDRVCLTSFGGHMTIEEFRTHTASAKLMLVNYPPMMSVTQQVEEVNEAELRSEYRFIPIDNERVNKYQEKIKLKRSKPLVNFKNTLDSTMNLRYH
jgi:hypothetical protein